MPTYDDVLFTPPAPVVKVTLRHHESGATFVGEKSFQHKGAKEQRDKGAESKELPRKL